MRRLVAEVVRAAEDLGVAVGLVGGPVRDWLLERPIRDPVAGVAAGPRGDQARNHEQGQQGEPEAVAQSEELPAAIQPAIPAAPGGAPPWRSALPRWLRSAITGRI